MGADALRARRPETRSHGDGCRAFGPGLRRADASALPRGGALEADRCLECGGVYAVAPCVEACPADVDVPAFVAALARDEPEEAARIVFAENLLGGTCARVCPVELFCQGACVLQHEGRKPVEIGRLQRFACDVALATGAPLRRGAPYNWLRVAVIGAGPAGLACAGELAALGYDVTVYDERIEPGGLVRYAIAPYRIQRDPLPAEARVLAELGVHFELGIEIDSPLALAAVAEDADAVVLAVGLGADVDVRYPGDDLPGVWESLPFIEALKTGEVPDGRRFGLCRRRREHRGRRSARSVRLGAGRVTMLYRRTAAEMPAYPHEVAEALDEGVQIEWLTVPVRFIGCERLVAVECRRMRLGAPDASGRARPEEVPGTEFVLPATTVVKAIGQSPRAAFLSQIDGVELDHGLIKVDPMTGQTGNPRYFAAGDATNGGATVVEAVRRRSAQRRASTNGSSEAGHERDPLACARRPGREDGIAALCDGAPAQRAKRAGVSGVRPRAARCALRAYTRVDDKPIRRHDAITQPDVVVVLEPSLLSEVDVAEGLAPGGFVLINAETPPESLAGVDVRCVPGSRLAGDSKFVNLVLVGALAAALHEPVEASSTRPSSCSARRSRTTTIEVRSRRATDG